MHSPLRKLKLILHSAFWLGLSVLGFLGALKIGWPKSFVQFSGMIFLFCLISYCQYVLLQLMHEVIHQIFQRDKGTWSRTAALLVAFPIGLTRKYTFLHLDHHRFFGDAEKDPDFPNYGHFPRSRGEFFRFCILHLSGFTALQQMLTWKKNPAPSKAQYFKYDKWGVIGFQILLLAGAFSQGAWFVYLSHWAFPLVSVVKLLGYLRILSEHGDPSKKAVLRSFRGSPILSSILGPYGLQYHAEHHLLPAVPYEELHHTAAMEVKRPSEFEVFQGNHFSFLAQSLRRLPPKSPGAAA